MSSCVEIMHTVSRRDGAVMTSLTVWITAMRKTVNRVFIYLFYYSEKTLIGVLVQYQLHLSHGLSCLVKNKEISLQTHL